MLHGGDWWSGISADVILEGRYELITWDVPKIVFTTLGDDPLAAERGLDTAERWLAQYPTKRSSRHGGVRLAFQVRF